MELRMEWNGTETWLTDWLTYIQHIGIWFDMTLTITLNVTCDDAVLIQVVRYCVMASVALIEQELRFLNCVDFWSAEKKYCCALFLHVWDLETIVALCIMAAIILLSFHSFFDNPCRKFFLETIMSATPLIRPFFLHAPQNEWDSLAFVYLSFAFLCQDGVLHPHTVVVYANLLEKYIRRMLPYLSSQWTSELTSFDQGMVFIPMGYIDRIELLQFYCISTFFTLVIFFQHARART